MRDSVQSNIWSAGTDTNGCRLSVYSLKLLTPMPITQINEEGEELPAYMQVLSAASGGIRLMRLFHLSNTQESNESANRAKKLQHNQGWEWKTPYHLRNAFTASISCTFLYCKVRF